MKYLGAQRHLRNYLFLIFSIVIFLLPFLSNNNYFLSILIIIGIYSIVIIGLCLLMGYTGQISLGHAAFYGLGAYTSGILTTTCHISPWLSILAGVLITGTVAFVIGIPIFKLKENFLALATLGFGLIIHEVFMEEVELTGGPSGLHETIPYLSIGKVVLNTDFKYYFLVWAVTLLAIIIANNVVNSRVGRALRSIHGSEFAAQSLGVNTGKYKLQVFALSAVYASIAGSLYAHYISFISPSPFGLMTSIQFVVMAVVGGLSSIWGPVLGVACITLLTEGLRAIVPYIMPQAGGEYQIVIYGVLLVVIMIFLPEGLTSGLINLYNDWKRKKGKTSEIS